MVQCPSGGCELTRAPPVCCVEQSFGGIDLLWNNAGYQGLIKPSLEYPIEDFALVYKINVVGAFSVAQKVRPRIVSSRSI